jgi:hypothetical protein
MAEREVVFDRVVGIDPAERGRDIARHLPSRAGIACQTQAAADPNHVRVEWNDQLGWRHARPDAEIERIATHHPTEEQVQALAATAG